MTFFSDQLHEIRASWMDTRAVMDEREERRLCAQQGMAVVLENAQKDREFVSQTGQEEDIAVVEAAQLSLASGANTHFTFGHFEPNIVHFHEQIDRFL